MLIHDDISAKNAINRGTKNARIPAYCRKTTYFSHSAICHKETEPAKEMLCDPRPSPFWL